jgi:hypothetical protein
MRKLTAIILGIAIIFTLAACVDVTDDFLSGTPTDTAAVTAPPVIIPRDHDFEITQFGGIDWLILEKADDKMLLLSDIVLESRYFHENELVESGQSTGNYTWVDWADSHIREYLGGEFYNSFSEQDRARIIEKTNPNPLNLWADPWFYQVEQVNESNTDHIFLLSIDEVLKYFGDSGQYDNRPTIEGGVCVSCIGAPQSCEAHWDVQINDEFNKARTAYDKDGKESAWWLRSPASWSSGGAAVWRDGCIDVLGRDVGTKTSYGVRPAMWVTAIDN